MSSQHDRNNDLALRRRPWKAFTGTVLKIQHWWRPFSPLLQFVNLLWVKYLCKLGGEKTGSNSKWGWVANQLNYPFLCDDLTTTSDIPVAYTINGPNHNVHGGIRRYSCPVVPVPPNRAPWLWTQSELRRGARLARLLLLWPLLILLALLTWQCSIEISQVL